MAMFDRSSGFFGDFLSKLKLKDDSQEDRALTNQVATYNDDGAIEIENAVSQFLFNLDFTYNSQSELLKTYRQVAGYSTVAFAVDDIVNEMVSFGEDQEPVLLDLTSLGDDYSERIKKVIYEKWDKISNILELKDTIHTRARQFYIDGRLSYQKVIDKNKPADGLLDIIELDSAFITKFRNKIIDPHSKTITGVEEYFIYNESTPTTGEEKRETRNRNSSPNKEPLQINPESITYVTSGLTDPSTGFAISWLHKAIKPANQLRMMENALVIYRITRAPERRIFYVDVANLPKTKAESYIRNLKNTYRNKMSFNPDSGSFTDNRHLQTMQEDYWLPRTAAGRGTEVTTLPGGQNLGDIEDLLYFQKELYKSLNVPTSRLEAESSLLGGRGAEINRDELKFSKFVSKVRKRFNMMFLDLLRTELILTKVMTIKEWNEIRHKIEFEYAQDIYIEELRKMEIERERLDLLQLYQPYIGTYVSNGFIRRDVMKQTDVDLEAMDKEIAEEKKSGQYGSDEDEDDQGRF